MAAAVAPQLTREWFETNIDGEWTKSVRQVPEINENDLIQHLVTRRSHIQRTNAAAKKTKSFKAYKFFKDGHVQRMQICRSVNGNMFIIKAFVLASMKKMHFKVYVGVEDQGGIAGVWCQCVSGKGECCNHSAATLFAISHYKEEGLDTIPSDKTCTEFECRWKGHAAKNTAPAALDSIRIVKYDVDKMKKPKSTLQSLDFDPRPKEDRSVNKEDFNNLFEGLKSVHSTIGFSRYAVPLPPIPDNVQSDQSPEADFCHPASLQDIKAACQRQKASLQLTPQEADDLEQKTTGQSASPLWHESRRLRLTASHFHQILHMKQSTCPSTFLKQQLYSIGRCQTKAMKLGLEREDAAAQRYKLHKQLEGEELTIKEAGFRVSGKGFLGASADRIAVDTTGRRILVELKNPENTWEYQSINDVPQKQKCLVRNASGHVEMNVTTLRFRVKCLCMRLKAVH